MQSKTPWVTTAQALIVGIIALISVKTNAEMVVETSQFTKCMNDVDLGAFKNTQWGACYEAELARQNKRLELEYKKLRAEYKSVDMKPLDEAKNSWLKYREQWCHYEEALPIAPTPYVNYRACLVNTTIEQINKIQKILPSK
jgi:uncharacterized protein YecT (DUF1311 family)